MVWRDEYQTAQNEMQKLLEQKKAQNQKEILDAYEKTNRSHEEILDAYEKTNRSHEEILRFMMGSDGDNND